MNRRCEPRSQHRPGPVGRSITAALLQVTLLLAAACAPPDDGRSTDGLLQSIEAQLEQAVAEDDTLPGASIHVIAPDLGIDWGTGVGVADPEGSIPFSSSHPTRISSVTKPFVAAAVLRLHEQGRIELDAPISGHLKAEHAEILAAGGVDPGDLTIRHLLTHTSGLVDTFNTGSFQQYFAGVLEGATPRSFTLEDQLRAAMDGGATTGTPGERQRYTDTGYILLGAILEELTGEDMASATRRLSRYGELAPNSTWWEIYEPKPAGALDRAAQYFGTFEGDGFGDQPFDLYGGGGMISSTDDLAKYFWGLFLGDVFEQPSTLEVMMAKAETMFENEGDLVVRHGLQSWTIDGKDVYGHGGWWGVTVYYSPESDVLVALNWLQQHAGRRMGALGQEIVADVMRRVDAAKATG